MFVSLQILKDDLWKLWSEIEMAQISMAVGLFFIVVILKMSLANIDRRDFVTELMYVIFMVLVFLVLLVVVPDSLRMQSTREVQIVWTIIAVFVSLLRWNTVGKSKNNSKSLNSNTAEAKNG